MGGESGLGRPRRSGVDDQIREAALALLQEQGPGAVSVASVAARTGLARTTIYRRFADREAILSAALGPVTDRGRPAPDLTVAEKVAWLLDRTAEVLEQGIGLGGVAAVLTDSDPEFSAALRRSLRAGLAPVRREVTADLASGALAPDLDADLVIDLVLGAYLAEALLRRTPSARWRRRTATRLAATIARS